MIELLPDLKDLVHVDSITVLNQLETSRFSKDGMMKIYPSKAGFLLIVSIICRERIQLDS